jgi:hypothetical protein
MKRKQRRWFDHDGHSGESGRAHEKGSQTGDDAVYQSKNRSSFASTIQNYELVPYEKGFSDHGTRRAAGAHQLYDCG